MTRRRKRRTMSFHAKLRHGRYVMMTAAILACMSSSITYAAPAENEGTHVSTDDIHVDVDFDKEMLKEAPETKTIISRDDLDRKGARTSPARRRTCCRRCKAGAAGL